MIIRKEFPDMHLPPRTRNHKYYAPETKAVKKLLEKVRSSPTLLR